MMPKSILLLATFVLASSAFSQTWNDPYASMGLPPQPTSMSVASPINMAPTQATMPQAQMANLQQPISLQLPALMPAPGSRELKATAQHKSDSMLPLRLAGYELRVMDITKQVSFEVNGQDVKADVPIFIYMPREPKSMAESTRELRKLYNDLIMLYDKETVDKQHVRDMLGRLDKVIDRFDALDASIAERTNAVN